MDFIDIIKKEKVFNNYALEGKLNIPQGLIGKHIRGEQDMSEKHLKKLNDYYFKLTKKLAR